MDEKTISLVALESVLDKTDRSNKRNSNIIIVILVLWFLTIAGFVWYITIPIEEETISTQTMEDIDGDNVTQTMGDTYGNNEAD